MASDAEWDDPPPTAFFLEMMGDHERVRSVKTLSPNRHDVTLTDGRVVRVFLTDKYTFSESDYAPLRSQHSEVTCIVSASSWNHFTPQARAVAHADDVATFSVGDFMGAIWHRGDAFLNYERALH